MGIVPRRNRNAHAMSPDADELAAQADQLAAEFGQINGRPVCLSDEIQLYYLSATPAAGKSSMFSDYLTEWVRQHPGCKFIVTDRKRELIKVVTGNGRD